MVTTMTNLALQLTTLDFTFRHVRIRRPRNPSKQRSHERFCWRCKNFCMNGCGGGVEPVEICSTRMLLSVSTLEEAVPQLHSAIAALDANPPAASSGVIRLEVPIRGREDALGWLREQKKATVMSRIFFSGREEERNLGDEGLERKIVSVAGVGCAVYFRGNDPFSFGDWKSIKRFLSKNNPFIRAYGAIRFDATRDISPEWKDFGSFYFIVPQISPFCAMSQNDLPLATIISHNDIPNRISWDAVVEKALQIIWGKSYECVKVVLARRSRMVTNTDMDPLIVLARLSVESQNAYQFCIQPSDAFAFIGNTPEKLFHRKYLHVSSEALAGTRRRGVSKDEDLQIENDLLQRPCFVTYHLTNLLQSQG
ncbi:putative Isochorismate synthase [Zostera marina]|uniref:Putative Isochorismate synthase n=1 Tax=Zostera marina TaxID=29655 RepID=A0A0K9PPK7_ZOSMR|nr:putative Isochorismate synthase [Zostera marina]